MLKGPEKENRTMECKKIWIFLFVLAVLGFMFGCDHISDQPIPVKSVTINLEARSE